MHIETEIEKETLSGKKHYGPPKLTVLGDIAQITLGADIGEELDAMFTVASSQVSKGRKKRDMFS